MSEHRLQDLLHERVADTVTTDLVTGAWERATRARRRRAAAVAGGIAAVVAAAGGAAVVTSGGGGERPDPPVTSPSASDPSEDAEGARSGPQAVHSGTYGGADVWWAPSVAQEDELPWLAGAPLPRSIDLSPGAPPVPDQTRALGVFQLAGDVPGRVVVLGADGTSYSLDASHLGPADAEGNTAVQLTHESLSPDGRHVFFVQPDSLEVYDLETGDWTTIPTAHPTTASWEGGLIKVGDTVRRFQLYRPDGQEAGTSTGSAAFPGVLDERDDRYGAMRIGTDDHLDVRVPAQAFHLGGPAPTPDGGAVQAVEAVVTSTGDGQALLASRTGDGRWLEGIPVAGWLDAATLLLESRWEEAKVLAWRVGTGEVLRVSDIDGWAPGEEAYVASFADLSDH